MTEMEMELARLREENARLKQAPALKFKIGPKGGLSVYGLGQRFPTTLYKDGWRTLLANADNIKAFLDKNEHLLAEKGE